MFRKTLLAAVAAANAPFVSERLFGVLRMARGKGVGLRFVELLAWYLVLLGLAKAIERIRRFVAPDGELLVISAIRDEGAQVDGPPWPLTLCLTRGNKKGKATGRPRQRKWFGIEQISLGPNKGLPVALQRNSIWWKRRARARRRRRWGRGAKYPRDGMSVCTLYTRLCPPWRWCNRQRGLSQAKRKRAGQDGSVPNSEWG